MGAPKGFTGNPNGRPKGAVNKTTALGREAIANFVDNNAERLAGWLDQIAADSPKDAFNCLMSVVEYHIPKLARSELTGKDGGAIETKDVTPNDKAVIERYTKQLTGQK